MFMLTTKFKIFLVLFGERQFIDQLGANSDGDEAKSHCELV